MNTSNTNIPKITEAKRNLAKMLEELAPYLPEPDIKPEPTYGKWENGDTLGNFDQDKNKHIGRNRRLFASVS